LIKVSTSFDILEITQTEGKSSEKVSLLELERCNSVRMREKGSSKSFFVELDIRGWEGGGGGERLSQPFVWRLMKYTVLCGI
jgi:hypothetical protein